MQEKPYPASRRDQGKRSPVARDMRNVPAVDRNRAADRPKIAPTPAQQSGVLRELAESPRHLD